MIHPTAIIDPGAELGEGVEVGPYAIVGAQVRIGKRARLLAHAVVLGPCQMGEDNVVHSFAVVGGAPQDKRAGGEEGSLIVGHKNVFREHVTVHRGTQGRPTRIGDENLFMVGTHVAHDVVVGSSVIFANGVMLAGHVQVEDHVTFGGAAAVAQRVRVGESAFVAGGSMVERDVPPFVVVQGDRARIRALNKVGLVRRGFTEDEIASLSRALRSLLFGAGPVDARADQLSRSDDAHVRALAAAFVRAFRAPVVG